MRSDHAIPGVRVVVCAGKAKGSVGIVSRAAALRPAGAGTGLYQPKATVSLDTGERITVEPRWLRPVEGA